MIAWMFSPRPWGQREENSLCVETDAGHGPVVIELHQTFMVMHAVPLAFQHQITTRLFLSPDTRHVMVGPDSRRVWSAVGYNTPIEDRRGGGSSTFEIYGERVT